jgi:hypothetical protein
VTDSSNPSSYLEASRLLVGEAFVPTKRNVSWGVKVGAADRDSLVDFESGTRVYPGCLVRQITNFSLDYTLGRSNSLASLLVNNRASEVGIILYPFADGEVAFMSTFIGIIKNRPDYSHSKWDSHETSFDIVEC